MFETEYREMFSQITASCPTKRRILNMKQEKTHPHGPALGANLLIAAVIISLLAVTASATGLTSWFVDFFTETNGESLTQSQVDYIEEKTQNVGLHQTSGGYTLSLRSAITDGRKTYVVLGVTAPEEVDLSRSPVEGYDLQTVYPSLSGNIHSTDGTHTVTSYATYWREDNDGKANTMDIVMMLDSYDGGFTQDVRWELTVCALTADCWNTAYEQELRSKYAGQENVAYTDEESTRLNTFVPLVEGNWSFTFALENSTQEKAFLSAPITVQASVGWDASGKDVLGEVKVNSIVLRQLSATVTYAGEYADFSCGDRLRVVMRDGSQIPLWSDGGSTGIMYLFPETPIVLEEVDHLLLPDGTVLPTP